VKAIPTDMSSLRNEMGCNLLSN